MNFLIGIIIIIATVIIINRKNDIELMFSIIYAVFIDICL